MSEYKVLLRHKHEPMTRFLTPHSQLFDMTPVSGRAQDQSTLSLFCHFGAGLLRDAAYGRSDGFLELSQVLRAVPVENLLDMPLQKEIWGRQVR